MTVKQTLCLFAELVGHSRDKVEDIVDKYLVRFAMEPYASTKTHKLSGGNKRKMCCAMAMIGNPKVIFIDEATTGVDPASRQIIWQGIKHEGRGSAVIYTTHAMEEAEAISDRLTIMVRGLFKCFGSL